jgi:hypothetical protein
MHVMNVHGNTFLIRNTIPTADLPHAGHAGSNLCNNVSMGSIAIPHFDPGDRTGTDKTHVAEEHVPKLGKLIETGFAEIRP